QAGVGQREVVRAGLAADADAATASPADQVHAARRRDVQNVEPAAGQLGQFDVTVDHHFLGGRWPATPAEAETPDPPVHDAALAQVQVLGVAEHRLVEHPAVLQSPAHDLGADHRRTVVGERHGTAVDQAAHLGQFLPLPTFGDGTDGEDVCVAG